MWRSLYSGSRCCTGLLVVNMSVSGLASVLEDAGLTRWEFILRFLTIHHVFGVEDWIGAPPGVSTAKSALMSATELMPELEATKPDPFLQGSGTEQGP